MLKSFLLRYTLWVTSTVIITLFVGCFYFVTQQALRQLANEPQIQMAHDSAASLTNLVDVHKVVPAEQKNIPSSRGPFVVVYQDTTPVAGNGFIDGKLPTLPAGVLEYARAHGENRITWQPNPATRLALVVVPFTGEKPGYVAVARSLVETERMERQVLYMVGIIWVVATLSTLVINLFILRSKKPAPQHEK